MQYMLRMVYNSQGISAIPAVLANKQHTQRWGYFKSVPWLVPEDEGVAVLKPWKAVAARVRKEKPKPVSFALEPPCQTSLAARELARVATVLVPMWRLLTAPARLCVACAQTKTRIKADSW